MPESPFTPRAYQEERVPEVTLKTKGPDKIGAGILKVQQYLVAALLFLVPVFFVPGLPASLGFDKAILGIVVGSAVVVLAGLLGLRYTKVESVLPYALGAFWLLAIVGFVSAALSGDVMDSLRGSIFESQTAGFIAVMALLMTVPLVMQRSKKMSMQALIFFGAGAVLVLGYNLIRLFVGADSLHLNSFGALTVSPVGSFNDLAIFSALTVILSLVTLLQLPLKKAHQIIISVLSLIALMLLTVVNFFSLWIVVGFFALLLLVYIFSRDMLFNDNTDSKTQISPVLIITTIIVCLVSIVFVVAGDYAGAKVNELTQVDYLEVRPSMEATIDIAKNVYKEDILLGTGPNKFIDAWRLYKDQSINETIFWNTGFSAGFGYVQTMFVTLGILGGLCILAFHALYLHLGYRMLLKGNNADGFWYYFGVVTFTAAVFLWLMSYLYVSGPAILLLAALFTGLSFAAFQALVPAATKTIPLVSSRRRGFLLMTIVIVLIIGVVANVFTVAKQYVAQAAFTAARTQSASSEEFQQRATEAYMQFKDETFLLVVAQSRLATLQGMLSNENPSKEDQEKFLANARQAVLEVEESIKVDDSNPATHATLADVFIVLATAGFTDAADRATSKLEDAKWRDPQNPLYYMAEASLAIRLNDSAKAREKIQKALEIKRNYSEALFMLSQIDVKDGNLDNAVATAKQIVTLEPNNPTRYYQLGVLLAAKKDLPGSIEAYEAAIARDNNFANARYMLALSYLDSNRLDDALVQLRIVRETNQENKQLGDLINQLETNGYAQTGSNTLGAPVNEAAPNQQGENVVSPTDPNTNLVSPVNTNPQTEQPAPAAGQ